MPKGFSHSRRGHACQAAWVGWVLCAAFFLSACKTERSYGEKRQELDPIRRKFAGNYTLQRDENGMVRVQSERRSDFESKACRTNREARLEKEYRTKEYKAESKEKEAFRQTGEFETGRAREQEQASRWQWPWKNRAQADGFDKRYDVGEDYETGAYADGGRAFETGPVSGSVARREYSGDGMDAVRTPQAGDGPGPSIREVRDLIGKDD